MKLHIDIETFCELNLTEVGVYRYTEHPSFKIILFAYQWDDEPTQIIDCYHDCFPGESIPDDIWQALKSTRSDIQIYAHNANFEMVCISRYFGINLHQPNWNCTMISAAYLGLPLGLDSVAKVLALAHQKDAKGKALIKFFCAPFQSRKKGEGVIINLPEKNPEKWEQFKAYGIKDVQVECAIEKYISRFPGLSEQERKYWFQDQKINATGITIDTEFIQAAINVNSEMLSQIHKEICDITGIDNPNSLQQLKAWLKNETGNPIQSLNKEYLAESINKSLLPKKVTRVLELRQMGSRTSTSKYSTMLSMKCDDNRIRGLIQFYGANRTGRYSGRGVQPQNLKKTFSNDDHRKLAPHLIDDGLEIGKRAIISGTAPLLYDDVPDLISKLVRTCFIASEGKSLVASDFSAIEGRVLAWLAGEEWALEVYRTHGKIYEATAAQMFNVPIESVTKGSELRAKGKIATLALGYQGWSGALIAMGALREGLTEEELPDIAKGYRNANPKTVKLWGKLENTARHVIQNKSSYVLKGAYCDIKFSYEKGYLFITLPSGRRLAYNGAEVKGESIRYWGLDQVKKIWVKMQAYGGLLTENITQAIARDILADAMYRMRHFEILMHIHDEVVVESDDDSAEKTLKEMEQIMSTGPDWAKGLPLKSEGYISKFYRKD